MIAGGAVDLSIILTAPLEPGVRARAGLVQPGVEVLEPTAPADVTELNRMLDRARARWVALLDPTDVLAPHASEAVRAAA